MRQTTKDNTKRTEKRFAEHLHESLVAHRIITNPRVVKCGTYYSWERFIKHRIQCEHIKECPICRDRTLDYRRHQMLEKQEGCLENGGSLFIITGTLKHKKTDSLKFSQNKLSTAVGKLKNQKGWRKLQQNSYSPTSTVYECTYSENNGFHPHVHMMYFADNQIIKKTTIRETLNPYWKNYTGANLDVTKIDSPTPYVGGKKEYPESLESMLKEQKDMMRKHFTKSELEIELVKVDNLPDYEPPLTIESILKGVKEMNDNQSYYNQR